MNNIFLDNKFVDNESFRSNENITKGHLPINFFYCKLVSVVTRFFNNVY